MKTLIDAAHEWVFETNGHTWSNNDDTAGDNFGSFMAGAKWQQEQELERLKEAYSMGRMGKSIKEFNETFKQQEQ